MDEYLEDRAFIETQGLAFATMIKREPASFSATLQEMASRTLTGQGSSSKQILGSLALRNPTFMTQAEKYDFAGDEVAIASWRKKYREFISVFSSHPSYMWGISQAHSGPAQWIRYQFAHSGFTHLFWNMLFLLLFGSFIELYLGGAVVMLTYLGAGIAGAWAYSSLSGISASPLVGASGAISGLMGLVALGWMRRERLKFFYWLLPARGYYGFTFLPSWLVLIAFLLPDLSGFLSAVPEYGSIAYSAHLGGASFGFFIALILRFFATHPQESLNRA